MANQPVALYPAFRAVDGTLYRVNDVRLIGMGNPPNDPIWNQVNPGSGNRQLTPVSVTKEDLDGIGN